MKQTRYNLPGHYITIRLNNQPLAQWLLEQNIAIPLESTGVRYACWASERGAMEIRVGWEEMRELENFQVAEALLELTPADKQAALKESLDSEAVQQGYRGVITREIYVELPHGTGFATSWYEDRELVKYERCDDEGEILALVDRGHLRELRWEKIPPIVQVIDTRAAVNCDDLREIRLEGVEKVEKGAFQRCSNLERVVVGPTVKEIRQGAFDRCENLREVDTSANPDLSWLTVNYLCGSSDQTEQAGDWTYEVLSAGGVVLTGSRKDEYTTLAIPETLAGQPVIELAEDAFIDKLFQKVTLPKTVEKLGDGCLYSPVLRQAELYGEATPDVTGPFSCEIGCCKLQKVTILPGTRRIADCLFEDLFGLREVSLPDTLEEIGDQAFCGCGNLKTINFPEGLKSIGDSAFWDCDSLEEITLPATLESIGSDAFGDCGELRRVYLPRDCQVAEDAFDECDPDLELIYLGEEPVETPEEPVPAVEATVPAESALDRLLRYVTICTTSQEDAETCPSAEGQLELAQLLVRELRELGVGDARVDQYGYVYGHLPATPGLESAPALGLIAHLDTAAFRGENVRPQVVEQYDGGDVALGESGKILRPADFPHLAELKGRTLVTTDGTTLLGADDKAGIAEIMTLVAELAEGTPHGALCVAFTPDEEIGAGADRFDRTAFGADFAYTVDGGREGEIQYENFNACLAELVVHGFDVHPGEGKDTMVNAALVAMECNTMLPAGETPRDTEDYEGFYHLDQICGNVERAELRYLIRDHSAGGFQARKDTLTHVVKLLNEKYGPGTVELTLRDQYANMAEVIQQNFHLIDRAKAAAEQVGLTPRIQPIRGGTDGARLSWMGLPCPNLGTGGFAFHGPYEHITAQGMDQVVEMLHQLARAYTRPV